MPSDSNTSIQSILDAGTQLWLDSVDPDLVKINKAMGATGATSNPAIISSLVGTGRFDEEMAKWSAEGASDEEIAWKMADWLVNTAEAEFLEIWEGTNGNDGYVSFELDPLIEDPEANIPHAERVQRYIDLGTQWSAGHKNRMIKVPATPAGLEAIETLAAQGVPLNVTLIFSDRQYEAARDAVWKGAQRSQSQDQFKSVYSIFVSRIDVYTEDHVAQLSDAAQGMVGIVNAKRIWQANQEFWKDKGTKLEQQIVFASTGTKKPEDAPWKYVEHLCGSDIQTNPPSTNEKAAESGKVFTKMIDQMPSAEVLEDIDSKVDFAAMEETLMEEGIAKFAKPQKALLDSIAQRRAQVS